MIIMGNKTSRINKNDELYILFKKLDKNNDDLLMPADLEDIADDYFDIVIYQLKKKVGNIENSLNNDINIFCSNVEFTLKNYKNECFVKNNGLYLTIEQKERYSLLELQNIRIINKLRFNEEDKIVEIKQKLSLFTQYTTKERAIRIFDAITNHKRGIKYKDFFDFFKNIDISEFTLIIS